MSATPAQPAQIRFSPWQFGGLLALLIVAAFPQVIFGLETFVARDYGFFVYPLAHFQRDCFWHLQLPFWDPYNYCGVPFLAQWNTMPLYPPSLIYLALPLNWSLSFFSLAHLWFAGMGMFFLARRWTDNSFAAAFAGTAFAFNGFTLNLLMWPSHMATFSWMPWVVLAVEAAWRQGGRKIPAAALVGAMQMLAGGPETIFLTWIIVSLLWVQQFFSAETPRGRMLWRYPLVVLLVFMLSAAQLLPFLDLVAHAQRATGYTDLRWSMPGTGLANFLVPMAFGSTVTEGIFFQNGQYWTSSYYLGMGCLWLAILAVSGRSGGGSSRRWLLVSIALVALLCALGEHTPFYPFVRSVIPQLSFITYPIKFVMVFVFAAPLLAAFALTRLAGNPGRLLFSIGGLLLLLIGVIIVQTQRPAGIESDANTVLLNALSRVVFLAVTAALFFILMRDLKSGLLRFAPLILILVAWLDVFTHEPRQNPTVPPTVYEQNLVRTRLAMNPQPELGGFRAMLSTEASLTLTTFGASNPRDNFLAKRAGYCANANLLDGVPKVDGFFSLTPREFDHLLAFIYNVTNGDWTAIQDFMGVSQVTAPTNLLAWQPRTSALPLITAGQRPVFLDDTNALWAIGRGDFAPAQTVFLPPEDRASVTATNQTTAKILASKFADNSVDFEAEASEPSVAVIAQSYYHNWRAEMDGSPIPLLRANVAFQAVELPPGKHQFHLYYRDAAFETGAAISACAWVGCLAGCFGRRRRNLS